MSVRILLLGCLVMAQAVFAAESDKLATLKAGTNVYTQVTITLVTATDLYFSHSQGLGTAKLRDLEPELQSYFHFDAQKSASKEAQQVQANALYAKALRDAPPPKRRPPPPEPEPEPPPAPAQEVPPHKLYAKSFLGQPAPDLTVEKWLTDAPDTNGKFVLVDFWATWCGPCRQAIPHLNQLSAKFKDRMAVIGLSNESEQAVRNLREPRIDYSVAVDTHGRTYRTVQVKGIPHAILIDPKGIVRFEGMPHYLNEANLATLLARYQ